MPYSILMVVAILRIVLMCKQSDVPYLKGVKDFSTGTSANIELDGYWHLVRPLESKFNAKVKVSAN